MSIPSARLPRKPSPSRWRRSAICLRAAAVAFSDDAFPIENAGLMRRVMDYCAMFDAPVLLHCEDKSLSDEGLMNEGLLSTVLGLKGIPDESEEVAVARNVILARLTGCRVHIQHVSTKGSVEIIRTAKEAGSSVTCETCPQYFTLTEEAVSGYDTNAKMNPPLRTADDVAIKAGLADGTIDVIATDHAPHAIEEKETEFAVAASGMIGLETAVSMVLTELVKPGILTLFEAVREDECRPCSDSSARRRHSEGWMCSRRVRDRSFGSVDCGHLQVPLPKQEYAACRQKSGRASGYDDTEW